MNKPQETSAPPYVGALPAERLEQQLGEMKPALTLGEQLTEAAKCLYCYDAPCIPACPTHINIPEFIRKIASGNLRNSAKTIFDANILGMSCARVCPTEVLCEGACVYTLWERPPVKIGRLQRVATDWAFENNVQLFERGASSGKKVAIIGGGPAGLACAHELAIHGHESVIFEARELPGGLNTTGVAPYKMNADASLREVQYILEIGGIELRTGVRVGDDVTFKELEDDFDAIFLGAGLGPDGRTGVDGSDLDGVWGACDFIDKIKTAESYDISNLNDVVVVGGGNTALDVVREMARAGVPRVTLVYRRNAENMPGYAHEADHARTEGVRWEFLANPVAFLGDNGHVTGVRCERMKLGEPDESGRRRPESTGETFDLAADMVAEAIGQAKLEGLLAGIEGLELDWGKVVIDPETGQTKNPKYFAGGDCVNGGKEVVNAAHDGKTAARGIDRFMRGEL